MSSVAQLVEELRSVQRRLVAELQAETFCTDIEPPAEAFGWDAQALLAYFENGGEVAPSAAESVANTAAPQPLAPAQRLLQPQHQRLRLL